jgi:hypothetical protein
MTVMMAARTIAATCLVLLAAPAAGAQANATGVLQVTVVDESGGVLPTAAVTIARQDDPARAALARVSASDRGIAVFTALAPGRYTLQVTFPGFEAATVRDVRVRAGDNRRTVALRLETLAEAVTVTRDSESAALDPGGLSFSTLLTREMIDALPDDPDEMAAVLEAMAPPGARIRVDGFSGGTLPHKSQIKAVRLPRMDAMAAENHGGAGGFLFIDIRTQPGTGPIRASVDTTFYDDAFSAGNPFTPAKGAEQTRQYGTSLAGTLVPDKTSFSVNVGGTSEYASPNLLAVRPDGSTRAEALQRPTDVRTIGIRVDHALTRDHSLRVSFDRTARDLKDQGIGGFNLPDRAFETTSSSNVVRLAEGGPRGKRMYTESRLQLSWTASENASAVEAPTIRVVDAFTSGGAQMRGGQHALEIEAATDLDYVRGAHAWRMGVLVEGGRYRSDDTTNYLGTYTFASLAAFNAGVPSTYTRRTGDPAIAYDAWQTGVYLEDDWRLARSVLVSAGVRAGVESLVRDPLNISPRLTIGWSPFRSGKLTVRTSYGYLYDWIDGALYKQSQLVDGFRLQEVNVTQPSFPDPPAAGTATPTNRYLWPDDLVLPTAHRLNVGADRQVTPDLRLSATYTWAWGLGLPRGRNLNAPVDGVRPDPAFANVIALAGDAESSLHAVNVGGTFTRATWKRLFVTGSYTWTRSRSNTTGAFSLPANGDDLGTEWGPIQAAHVATASVIVIPVEGLNLNVNVKGHSGTPYNITTGRDDNLDGLFADRPAGVGRNSARTAAAWDINGRAGYTWRFGPPAPGVDAAGRTLGKLSLNVWMSFQNLLNRANYVGYSGVMTSRFFGEPTNVANPRRMQMGLRFGF